MADDPKAPVTGEPVVDPKVVPAAPAAVNEWLATLPEPLRGEKTLTKFKDPAALAQSYVNLEKMPRGVTAPKDDAPDTEWNEYYEKLGRPKTVDEYKIKAKVPEGVIWNDVAEKTMLTKMHARGLSTKQAQGLINDYLGLTVEGLTEVKRSLNESKDTAEAEMRKEWGGLADRNISLVQRVVHEFGGEEFKTYLDETGLGNDPRFMKFVHALGVPMLEDNLIKGEGLGMKRAEAATELETIMKSKEYLAGDKQTIERVRTLYPLVHSD